MTYSSIRIEGNIISPEILDKLEQGDYAGQGAKDFGFESKLKVKDDIQFAWVTAKDYWKIFQRKLERLPADASRTSETRNDWIRPLLELLGYKLESAKPELVGEKSYPISNRAANVDGFSVHIIGFQIDEKDEKNDLDKRQNTTGAKMSAHGMVQEYLNLTEHLYAIVTNGRYLRVLRDSGRIVKLSFLEFDLHRMMEDDLYADFAVMYRLLHATRMPHKMEEGATSLIERYHQDSLDAGSRIREQLSSAVEKSIVEFAGGFLEHPSNTALIAAIEKGDFTADKMYQELLRLIYRFLFLMVTEERRLIYSDENDSRADVYYKYYSVERLRVLSEKRLYDEGRYDDLWEQLKTSFKFFEKKVFGEKIGILPLDGDLFGADALLFLGDSRLKNNVLLTCLRNLCTFENEQKQLIRVNYGSLDVEEFGSVYEGLLEYDAVLSSQAGKLSFGFKKGEGRSSSGSHYTPEELVQPLIKHSLDYVIEEKLKSAENSVSSPNAKKGVSSPSALQGSSFPHASGGNLLREAKRNALLSIKVCDVACGSGHILLSAARRIATVLAQITHDEEQPSPKAFRAALRDVMRHCIYGVDKNPLAVELCKVALWLEAHNPGMPLTFLDHRIKCGDSIVGLARKEELENGIATEAFKTLPGDDKDIASAFRKKNESERKAREDKQQTLQFDKELGSELDTLLGQAKELQNQSDDTVEDFHRKREFYEKMQGSEYWRINNIADLQVAQFFISKTPENKKALASDTLYFDAMQNKQTSLGDHIYKAAKISVEKKIFHWFLEYPEVFEQGGFDCILGNPPFLGDKKLNAALGKQYLGWLSYEYSPAGIIDLVGFFFRRNFILIKKNGYTALISTNSIAQGDTRVGGLQHILHEKGNIAFAIKSIKWPGQAAVQVSLVSIMKGNPKICYIGNRIVPTISTYLDDELIQEQSTPFKLLVNGEKAFVGVFVYGEGFIITKDHANILIDKNKKNIDILFPYLGGKELNTSFNQIPDRYIINFKDWERKKCEQYLECFEILTREVKPFRDVVIAKGDQIHEYDYWKYWDKRNEQFKEVSKLDRILVLSRVSKTLAFTFVPTNQFVIADSVVVFGFAEYKHFAILQSVFHNCWIWKYCTTMKTDPNYGPSKVYQTYPFPLTLDDTLTRVGKEYYEFRHTFMQKVNIGLTKTYNLFHNSNISPIIVQKESKQSRNVADQAFNDVFRLRQLRKEMDEAVAQAYGWSDLNLEHGFHEVEYLPENDRIRYTISEKARKEVLRRLLELNHKIHEEEVKSGLWEEKKGKAKGKKVKTDTQTGDLFS